MLLTGDDITEGRSTSVPPCNLRRSAACVETNRIRVYYQLLSMLHTRCGLQGREPHCVLLHLMRHGLGRAENTVGLTPGSW